MHTFSTPRTARRLLDRKGHLRCALNCSFGGCHRDGVGNFSRREKARTRAPAQPCDRGQAEHRKQRYSKEWGNLPQPPSHCSRSEERKQKSQRKWQALEGGRWWRVQGSRCGRHRHGDIWRFAARRQGRRRESCGCSRRQTTCRKAHVVQERRRNLRLHLERIRPPWCRAGWWCCCCLLE